MKGYIERGSKFQKEGRGVEKEEIRPIMPTPNLPRKLSSQF